MNFTDLIKTAGSTENLTITYKRTTIDTPFEENMKGYELHLNGNRTYCILTKNESYWIAYDLHQCDLALRKATEHIAADTLTEAKETIVRMLNIQFRAQNWYDIAAAQKDPKAKHLAIIVGDSVLEYNYAMKHCIEAFDNRITELETIEDLEKTIPAAAEPQEKIGAVLDMYLTSESTGEKNAYVKFAYLQCLKIRKDIFTIYLKHKHSESELDLKEVTGLDLFDTMLTEIKAFGFNKNIQVMFKK
jgi:hypothetical protein